MREKSAKNEGRERSEIEKRATGRAAREEERRVASRGTLERNDDRIRGKERKREEKRRGRISLGLSTSFLQSVRLMRIRRPRLRPPASKSKAFAKVVTFRREDAWKRQREKM